MPLDIGEWLSPQMRLLPPDVRGLWIDLLCCMWDSVERGVMVKPNNVAFTKEEIVKMLGVDCKGSDNWLDVLVDEGICGVRESDGAYYCKKMVRKEEISAKRRAAGKKGGDTTKAKVFAPIQEEKQMQEQQQEHEVRTVKSEPTPVYAPPPPPPPTEELLNQYYGLFPLEALDVEKPPPLTPEQQAKADKAKKFKYADYVSLTIDEYAKLCAEYGEEPTKRMIDIINNYKGSSGKKYKSDFLTIRGWVKDKYYEDCIKYGTNKNNGGFIKPPEQTNTSTYHDTL